MDTKSLLSGLLGPYMALLSPYSSGKAARAARTRIFFQKEYLGLSWARFGPSWARLGPSWGCFEVLGGPSWAVLAVLGPSWAVLGRPGPVFDRLGQSRGRIELIWAKFGVNLGSILGQ